MSETKKSNSVFLKVIGYISAIFVVIALIGYLIQLTESPEDKAERLKQDSIKNVKEQQIQIDKEKGEKVEENNEIKEYWEYSESEDKMTGVIKKYAVNTSTNKLNFEFPYDGGSSATITLRKNNKSLDVLLKISKGQFITSYSGGTIRVKFGESQPTKFKYALPSDGSSDILFIEPANKFVNELKKSNNVIIEAEFYNEGLRQMEFNVTNLKWE